jgi:hypothetical protein
MAELMFGLGQTKKKKESEAKVRNTKAHLKDVTITETVESNVRSDQHGREKNEKAKRNFTKEHLRNVNITETVETNSRAAHHGRNKDEKNVRAETKTNLRDVNITDTVESDVRNKQHSRDKEWKETGKQQKKSNTSFDMAREYYMNECFRKNIYRGKGFLKLRIDLDTHLTFALILFLYEIVLF